jgi:hypothetical protein
MGRISAIIEDPTLQLVSCSGIAENGEEDCRFTEHARVKNLVCCGEKT